MNRTLLALFVLLMGFIGATAQESLNEAEWSSNGYSIKKIVSNTSIQSGVNFSYTILFTVPAGQTSVTIEDVVPAALNVVTVPLPSPVSGVTPNVSISGNTVTYTLAGLPTNTAHSGSFTIVVRFPAGVTCPGASARNRAGILVGDKWNYTPFVSTSVIAEDPWRASKAILSGAVVNPTGGTCGYLMNAGSTVTYRLSVLKSSPFWGNTLGQLNASNAVVNDVLPAGAQMISYTGNAGTASQTGNTITWNIGNLAATTAYAYYYIDVQVEYPAASFPNGTVVNNEITLSAEICQQQVTHVSNETCIEVTEIVANQAAFFRKYIYLTNRVPGCDGFYRVAFKNNGNVSLSAFNIDDVVPTGITVNSVMVSGGTAGNMLDLYADGNIVLSNIIGNTNYNFTTSPSALQLQMNGTLPVNDWINLYIYFTVDNNPNGTQINNCASFDGLSNSLTLSDACVSMVVDEGEPKPCLIKDICSPEDSYEPGDIVRFRLRVQNIGSADLIGATIEDALHSNFTYIGNESYYVANHFNPPCSGAAPPVGSTPWSGVVSNHSGNNLSWNIPVVESDCQLFYVAYCGYYGTWGLPYHYIEFDAMVDSFALPGVTPNNYEISGGNLNSTVTSNTVNVLVVASFGQEVEKLISVDGGSNFATSANVAPGASARYRLNYRNTSNVPVSEINMVDLLARNDGTDDWLVLDRPTSRGSQFDVQYAANHSSSLSPAGTVPTPALSYAAGQNVCLPQFGVNFGCNTVAWGTTPDQNINFDYGSFNLAPAQDLFEDFDITVPTSANDQELACNDFAAIASAGFLLNGNPQLVTLTPIPAPPVCLTVDSSVTPPDGCCDQIDLFQIEDHGCCVRLVTHCEVRSVEVTVTNGTLSSSSWNCTTAMPTDYAGESNYTFYPDGCAVDLMSCIAPDQSGAVSITYSIIFMDGTSCEKTIDIECEAPVDCCEGNKLYQNEPSDEGDCCVTLETECEVRMVEVSVNNGVLSYANWSCPTALPNDYVGENNYTFYPDGCAVDLKTCVTPDESGIVTITYLITYMDGSTCEEVIEIDCKAPVDCCEGNKLYQNEPSDEGDCCVTLETECEVRSVEVSVENGVLSYANWSCPTALPNDYVGESNYTFYPDGCAVDLKTCVTPDQSGVVTITYLITYMDGSSCEEVIEIECKAPVETACCPLIDFKLRQRWPYFQSHIGVFNITNVDPNTSICSIEINASPAGSFTPVSLIVDGTTSGQSWTSSSIPAVGNLTNPATNNIQFSLLGANYKGVIEVCVTMCDGSVCCYEVEWNRRPVIDVGVGVDNVNIGKKLHAVSIKPVVTTSISERVKYISFGYFNEEQIKDDDGFFAASVIGGGDCDDGDQDIHPGAASLGRYNVFFEMKCPYRLGGEYAVLPVFNLVFSGDLPEIGCTLFDEDGNIIYSGKINNIESDTVTNSVIDPAVGYEGMLDVVSVYPNPNTGDFTMTYATGSYASISVKIVNSKGQLVSTREILPKYPGLHEEKFFENNLHEGVYHIIIESDGRSVSKSFIKR